MPETNQARRRAGFLGALFIVAALMGTILFAAPAQADTVRQYWNGYVGNHAYLAPRDNTNGAKAFMGAWWHDWTVQQISDSPSGHDRVYLKTNLGRCLDDNAQPNGGTVKVITCNGGDYQIWEVFYQSSGARVFKSWGAWTKQSRHLCLSKGDTDILMSTCNESSTRQHWYPYAN